MNTQRERRRHYMTEITMIIAAGMIDHVVSTLLQTLGA